MGPVRATTGFRDVSVYGRALGGDPALPLPAGGPDVPPVSSLLSPARWWRSPAGPCRTRRAGDRAAALQHEIRDAPDARAGKRSPPTGGGRALRLARLGTGPVRLEVQAVRLGEALIVACEGVFVEYGARLKDASPADVTFVAAYSKRLRGLHPHPDHLGRGGYEVSPAPGRGWGGTGGRLTERAAPSPVEFGQARLTGRA